MTWCIPPATEGWLQEIPSDRPVAMLLRHSVRLALPEGEAGYRLPITAEGELLARQLGALMGPRLRSLHTSPLTRTVQTAEALKLGAGGDLQLRVDRLLGDPGVFVVDSRAAGRSWQQLGHQEMMARLVSGRELPPGVAAPSPAARFLVRHMLSSAGSEAGLHVFVTHDSLVTATAANLLDVPLGEDDWPWYLGAAFFWEEPSGIWTAYREHRALRPGLLCQLSPEDVVELARREVLATIGADCPARFFLAGGCFKTLLTGRPPRDLDLWTPTERDRALLLQRLSSRGARPVEPRPFSDAFEIAGRVVELPHAIGPGTLEERLAHFDIALSAVGVEHLPGEGWRPVIHPLARQSAEGEQVLLLKPLFNWKYALVTLERMRRYAAELGFTIPASELDEVWRVFDARDPDQQLQRYRRAGGQDAALEAEAMARIATREAS